MRTTPELLPPVELLSDGTTSLEDYVSVGENFVNYFLINHARLQPHERVLDLGSGIGQKARPLSRYLTGRYDGLDIMNDAVEWCQQTYGSFPNFRFQVADIYSAHYRPEGKMKPERFNFPFESQSYDLVLLSSVFTHMLPVGVRHYIAEISRVLRPGGRCVATFFLLNHEAWQGIIHRKNIISAPYLGEEGCYVADPQSPDTTVFHEESWMREVFWDHGLSITEITFGFWSGRVDFIRSLQDVVISTK